MGDRGEDAFSEEYVSTSSTGGTLSNGLTQSRAPATEEEEEEAKYKEGKPVRIVIRAQVMHGESGN